MLNLKLQPLIDKAKPYAKAVIAVAGAVAAVAAAVAAPDADAATVAIAVLTALGVYRVPNVDA